MFQKILNSYGLSVLEYQVEPYGSGLINHTWKVFNADQKYILQKININVFKSPQAIDENLAQLKGFLANHAPNYLFVSPLPNLNGSTLLVVSDEFYRLFPFVENSHSIDFVTKSDQAYEVAKQFGKFTSMFSEFEATNLNYTLPDFHNLPLRVAQFFESLENAEESRLEKAKEQIDILKKHIGIADTYSQLIKKGQLTLRVIHHDTKINNVLLDQTERGICVIDLDTVMPGYFISDVGDMMRTYLSEANEEEKDLKKINVREEIFTSIYRGYMSKMGSVLTADEKKIFVYSGKYMIYMQALRFLTDFLNGDTYYQTTYENHNLVRAKNQIELLEQYLKAEDKFSQIISGEILREIAHHNN